MDAAPRGEVPDLMLLEARLRVLLPLPHKRGFARTRRACLTGASPVATFGKLRGEWQFCAKPERAIAVFGGNSVRFASSATTWNVDSTT